MGSCAAHLFTHYWWQVLLWLDSCCVRMISSEIVWMFCFTFGDKCCVSTDFCGWLRFRRKLFQVQSYVLYMYVFFLPAWLLTFACLPCANGRWMGCDQKIVGLAGCQCHVLVVIVCGDWFARWWVCISHRLFMLVFVFVLMFMFMFMSANGGQSCGRTFDLPSYGLFMCG